MKAASDPHTHTPPRVSSGDDGVHMAVIYTDRHQPVWMRAAGWEGSAYEVVLDEPWVSVQFAPIRIVDHTWHARSSQNL